MPDEREIAGSLVAQAKADITTVRGQQHGDLETSFTMIAEMWSVYINHSVFRATGIRPNPEIHLSPIDVLECMALVKKARNVYGSPLPDHTSDDIGYTALAGGLRLHSIVNAKIAEETAAAMSKAMAENNSSQMGEDGKLVVDIPAFLKEKQE